MRGERTGAHWRRFGIRLLVTVVLGLLIGSGWLVYRPAAERTMSIYGRPVDNATSLLHAIERTVTDRVRAEHGVRASDAHCFFAAAPATTVRPGSGATEPSGPDLPAAITDRVYCGPAILVGGSQLQPYLVFDLLASAEPDGGYRLSVSGAPGELSAADPRPSLNLLRPDGIRPPGRITLHPPAPPTAIGDVLTTSATVPDPLTAAPPDAVMLGRLSGVRLVDYGFVSSYGSGESARRAPAGYRLLAFSTAPLAGEAAGQAPDLSVRVDGVERGPLAPTSDYLVTAISPHARTVELVLTDSGVKQSVSLLTGRPAPSNPVVSHRVRRTVQLGLDRTIQVRVSTALGTGQVTGTLSVRSVSLTYWTADGSPCPEPDQAWLHVQASVRLAGDKRAYGAEPTLLRVVVAGRPAEQARNAAANPATEVDDVVAVPGGLTQAEIVYAGTMRTAKGTVTVLTPVSIPVTIPAS